MVNVRGRGAKEGAVYNIGRDQWEEMPSGMMAGWTGPAASDDEGAGAIYVVDEGTGEVRAYEFEEDS
ncbi:hypothetical protein HPP92_002252 [Vanilla planifolia]|nr:hypothetical protein HPP92_002507 [Vanilla planifolia]KAG0502180.1 hypothetical protein HPP92_002252 [Vanilla planifolia]